MIAQATERRVTVVMLTYNHAEAALETAGRLLALPEKPAVIVVDNASDDGTPRLLRERYPHLAVVSLARNIGAAARNAGARRATTPYVAFCEDDSCWDAGSLPRAADLLDAVPKLALVSGRMLVAPDDHEAPLCRLLATSPLPAEDDLPGLPLLAFLPGATVARREALLAVGGFEPHFHLGEEARLLAVDLAARGWSIAYVPEIVVRQRPLPDADAIEREWQRIRNELWFAWLRRPARVALRHTLRVMRAARQNTLYRRALKEAVAELPWVWHRRAVVPTGVERRLRLLEQTTVA